MNIPLLILDIVKYYRINYSVLITATLIIKFHSVDMGFIKSGNKSVT